MKYLKPTEYDLVADKKRRSFVFFRMPNGLYQVKGRKHAALVFEDCEKEIGVLALSQQVQRFGSQGHTSVVKGTELWKQLSRPFQQIQSQMVVIVPYAFKYDLAQHPGNHNATRARVWRERVWVELQKRTHEESFALFGDGAQDAFVFDQYAGVASLSLSKQQPAGDRMHVQGKHMVQGRIGPKPELVTAALYEGNVFGSDRKCNCQFPEQAVQLEVLVFQPRWKHGQNI